MPKLIVRRLTTNWKLLLAIFAGVTMASSLVAGALVYLWSLNRLSLNTAIDRASDKFLNLRTFAPFVPLMESALDATDQTVNEVLDGSLAEINFGVVRHLRTDSFLMGLPGRPLPVDPAWESQTPRMFFQTLSDFTSHVTVLEGRMAGDAVEEMPAGLHVEGVVGRGIASYFGVRAGDEIVLARSISQPVRMVVLITAVVAPIDPADVYWPPSTGLSSVSSQGASDDPYQIDRATEDAQQADLFDEADEDPELGVFVSTSSLLGSVSVAFPTTFSTIDYFMGEDKPALKQWTLEDVGLRLEAFESDLAFRVAGSASVTGITDMIEDFEERRFFSSIPLLLPVAVMIMTVLYYLAMMVSYLVESRMDDVVALRSRGTSIMQLLRIYAVEGVVVITFTSLLRAGNVGVDARALAGGASAAFFEPREGIYLAAFYTIKNETNSAVIPGTHVNNVFSLIDSQGRVWPTATYYSHGFEVAYALGVPDGKEDPRAWVDTGTSYDTALAFDVAEDATGLRLRSELLNLEIGLGE